MNSTAKLLSEVMDTQFKLKMMTLFGAASVIMKLDDAEHETNEYSGDSK